jgi:hypothetical protein
MLSAILSLVLAAQGAMPEEARMPIAPDAVLARVAACGVARHNARVRMDETLQEAVVDIGHAWALSDAQLACLARVSAEAYWFLVFDRATQARFEPLYARASEAESLKLAQAWVAAQGLAGQVPTYREGHGDPAVVVAKIETLCHAPSGTFRNDGGFMTPVDMAASAQYFVCALNLATVAGLKFGLIGNAAVAQHASR